LEDAALELFEWLLEGDGYDCLAYVTHFDALKRLHALGKLPNDDSESVVARMQPCDVFFALALIENDLAHDVFSVKALDVGRDPICIVQRGLDAAVSAANSYMYGLLLRARDIQVDQPKELVSHEEGPRLGLAQLVFSVDPTQRVARENGPLD